MDKYGNKVYLGLDVSTKCIGVAIVVDDGSEFGKIVELTHINPDIDKKIKGMERLFMKKRMFDEFLDHYKHLQFDDVIIEEPLLRSSNNLDATTTLLRFNGMVSEAIYSKLGIVPKYISSYDARKFSFPKLMGVRKYGKDEKPYTYQKVKNEIKNSKMVLFGSYPWTVDKKSVIQELVSEAFQDIQWVYNKNGELKKENFDASDAYVCVLASINKERHGELSFKTEIISEEEVNDEKCITYKVRYWDREEERKTYVNKA